MDYLAGERGGRSTRPLAMVIALLLVCGLAGAFTVGSTSGSAPPAGDPGTVLRAAASAATSTPMQLDSVITLRAARTVSYRITGQVDDARHLGRMTFDPNADLLAEPVEMLQIGTDLYVRVPSSRRSLTKDKPW